LVRSYFFFDFVLDFLGRCITCRVSRLIVNGDLDHRVNVGHALITVEGIAGGNVNLKIINVFFLINVVLSAIVGGSGGSVNL
jgi:hypothetical protein